MPLESSFTSIADLNVNWPAIGDLVSQGDDHLRGIKSALKNTFPNVNNTVTASDEELNNLVNSISNIQQQIDLLNSSVLNVTVQDFLLQNAGVA
jgi:hypothetical protein